VQDWIEIVDDKQDAIMNDKDEIIEKTDNFLQT